MVSRRRVLQSFAGIAAGCVVVHDQAAIGKFSSHWLQKDDSESLIELLQNVVHLCNDGSNPSFSANRHEALKTRQLCQLAISRVRRSSQDTPAFWQACGDSVSRLELAVSAHMEASFAESRSSSITLRELRSLKKQLEVQAIQAIGTSSRLA